ncbi:hypothetical protein [Priestia koreensis]|uniref:Uncharacterized protein n=1 Tax=Priestia koreensis TaxID=284581 RepID=A0A0M0LHK3_9BACI|nr:hypothetical protein [Priestia koreensis]KOO50524.1 hypothetical protein AMD01_01885 [Priestia koreensis]
MYKEFQYFLTSYCTLSLDQDDFWSAIQLFIDGEDAEIQHQLQVELTQIINGEQYKTAQNLIEEFGSRALSVSETKEWILHNDQQLKHKK